MSVASPATQALVSGLCRAQRAAGPASAPQIGGATLRACQDLLGAVTCGLAGRMVGSRRGLRTSASHPERPMALIICSRVGALHQSYGRR